MGAPANLGLPVTETGYTVTYAGFGQFEMLPDIRGRPRVPGAAALEVGGKERVEHRGPLLGPGAQGPSCWW